MTQADLSADNAVPAGETTAWLEVVEAGFDIHLLEDNLRRSVWERLQRHSEALRTASQLGLSRAHAHA